MPLDPTSPHQPKPHTPTPWDYVEGRTLLHVETQHDNPHGAGRPVCSIPKAREGDAARIVACVNACDGITDPVTAVTEARAVLMRVGSLLDTLQAWKESGLIPCTPAAADLLAPEYRRALELFGGFSACDRAR